MVDTSAELRTTSDLLLLDLEALGELEEQKRQIPHGDPKLVELATRIEEIAHRVLAGSRRQRELTETVTQEVDAGETEPVSIEDHRSMAVILADWREAERAARDAAPSSTERTQAESMIERFREEYRRAFDATRRARG